MQPKLGLLKFERREAVGICTALSRMLGTPRTERPAIFGEIVLIVLWTASIAFAVEPLDPTSARLTPSERPAGRSINFVRDVSPALTKAGCNAGACHGSFQGRGGFRLSLLGFDP
ncbi:MAG: hypothetical protein FD138_3936, partial [Planctomycetota bacterium]